MKVPGTSLVLISVSILPVTPPPSLLSPKLSLSFFNIKKILFIYLFLAMLGLCRCGGFSLVSVLGYLLIAVASLVMEHRL